MKEIIFILDYNTFKKNLLETALQYSPFADKIWLRIKNIDANEIFYYAKNLRTLLPDKYLILSERVDIASMLKFNAVHLNKDCHELVVLKKKFKWLDFGYSAHSTNEILSMECFDYFTLSPLFETKKDFKVKPIGAVDVSWINKNIYALGGINPDNIDEIKNKGYSGIAGISLYKTIKELKNLLNHP